MISGSVNSGSYDRRYPDFDGFNLPPLFNYSRKNTQENMSYNETILKSAVSQSITYDLGGPVTQPSTMIKLRREATVHCSLNATFYRDSFVTCNVTECLFDIENDPCETRNIVEQYPRVRKRSTLNLKMIPRAETNYRSKSLKSTNV